MAAVESRFEQGMYAEVITALAGCRELSARQLALLGISELRLGRFDTAEVHLARAAQLGDGEALVEYGNLLRFQGRLDQAIEHFEQIQSRLQGELYFRNLRWWGVAQFQRGETEAGLRRCEQAWHGYLALGDEVSAAKVTVALAKMYKDQGYILRSEQLLQDALRHLPSEPNPAPRLSALQNLLDIQTELGNTKRALESLEEAKQLASLAGPMASALLLGSEANLQLALGNQGAYLRALFELRDLSEKLRERELLMWVTVRIAEHHSRVGEHGQALQAVYRFETMQPGMTTPPSLVVLRGVLARRRGDYPLAIRHLEEGVALLRERGQLPELTRALLQLAYALYSARRREEATNVLGSALQGLLQLHTQPDFRHELEEAAELLHYASLEPDLASFLEPVLNNLAGLAGSPRLSAAEQIPLHVYTLGRQEVVRREEVLHFTLKGTPLLLVYLALNPNRTRGELELALYPDKDPVAAGNYVRSAIRELREALGQDAVIMEGSRHAPRYRLGPHLRVDLDLVRFLEAINHGELARALALYQGVFMPEIDDSPWVEHKREEARLALEFELRNQITCGREQGNLRRVILLCNQYLRFEPYDRDVHLERVQAARVVGGAGELARYISELQALED